MSTSQKDQPKKTEAKPKPSKDTIKPKVKPKPGANINPG